MLLSSVLLRSFRANCLNGVVTVVYEKLEFGVVLLIKHKII